MRQFLSKHSFAIGAIAVTITATCILMLLFFPAKPALGIPQLNRAYYYDLTDSKLVEAPDNLIPPVKHQGHDLVHAMVYACKSCQDKDDRALGFLKSFTPERQLAEQAARKGLAPGEELPVFEVTRLSNLGGVLIRSVDGDKFLPSDDPAAIDIIQLTQDRCPQSIIECKPF